MLLFIAFQAFAQGIHNPGGDRIPFVKLRSSRWDVVIRVTGPGRARLERVKARCGSVWVNGCAPGVDPELRKIALTGVFKPNVQLSGDFSYCSTAVLRELPADLAHDLIDPSTERFCAAFLDPASVRSLRSGDATRGERSLVERLMGGPNTTSGEIRIKAPPSLHGGASGEERIVTRQRRPSSAPVAPSPSSIEGADVDPSTYIEEAAPSSEPTPPSPSGREMAARSEEAAPPAAVSAGRIPTEEELLSDEGAFLENSPSSDEDLAALLAPLPGLPPEDQVVVPPPRDDPTRPMTELELLEAEELALEAIQAPDPVEERRRSKKKKKKQESGGARVGTDVDLGDYILIDIEELPEDQ